MKQFVKLTEIVTLSNSKVVFKPLIVGISAIAQVRGAKAGGAHIELVNGSKATVNQSVEDIFHALPMEDMHPEEKPAPAPKVEDEAEEEAEIIDPADIAACASAAALKLAEENGIDIADVPLNINGKISKLEVEKYLASLEENE